jgi:hypothetical protein
LYHPHTISPVLQLARRVSARVETGGRIIAVGVCLSLLPPG